MHTLKLDIALGANYEEGLEEAPRQMRTFRFPSIEESTKFSTFEQVKTFFREQNKQLGRVKPMFRFECDPNVANCISIRSYCFYCKARVYFKIIDGFFMPTVIKNEHYHEVRLFVDETEQKIYRFFRDSNRKKYTLRKIKQQATEKGFIRQLYAFQHKPGTISQEKINDWKHLEKQFINHKYEYLVDWGQLFNDKFPRIMVFASPAMRRNFNRFGDMVSFDITYNILKNNTSDGKRYRLGVFCVLDTNVRVLIAAYCILADESTADLAKMFQMFLKIHERGKQPQTFITDQQKTMEYALRMLRDKGIYEGIHIFDPFHMIDNLRSNLRGDEERMRECVKLISNLIKCRTLEQYNYYMKELQKDTENTILYDQFADRAEKVCYWQIPRAFIGIYRFTCQRINDIIKTDVPFETTIYRLVEKLMFIDTRLDQNSTEGFKIFKQQIELQIGDPRIKQVRLRYESKVFERFLQNYFKAKQNLKITIKDPSIFLVENEKTSQKLEVNDWLCQCDELDKTGVPCPHIIMCAEKSGIGYCKLFNQRWSKDVPVLTNEQIEYTRKSRYKPEHQYRFRALTIRRMERLMNKDKD